jgi:hypothetical protein
MSYHRTARLKENTNGTKSSSKSGTTKKQPAGGKAKDCNKDGACAGKARGKTGTPKAKTCA